MKEVLSSAAANPDTKTRIDETKIQEGLNFHLLNGLPVQILALIIVYSIFSLAHFFLLPPSVSLAMVPLASGSTVLFVLVWHKLRKGTIKSNRAHRLSGCLAAVILVNCLVHMFLTQDLFITNNLALLVIGCGMVMLDRRWFDALVFASASGWVVVVVMRMYNDDDWLHFGFVLLVSIALGYAIVISRRKNLSHTLELLLPNREQIEKIEKLGLLGQSLESDKDSLEKLLKDRTLEVVDAKIKIEDKERDRQLAVWESGEIEQVYRNAIASADLVPYRLSYDDECFTYIGEGIEELTGYSTAEFNVDLWNRIKLESKMRGAWDGHAANDVRDSIRSGEGRSWECDILIQRKDGVEVWVADTSVEFEDINGKAVGSIGILQNISDRKSVEKTLEDERNLLGSLIDNINEHVYVKGANDEYIIQNRVSLDFYGLKSFSKTISNEGFRKFWPQDIAEQIKGEDLEIMSTGTPLIDQLDKIDFPSAGKRWFLTTKRPIRDREGKIFGLVGCSRDVTAFKETENALRDKEEHLRLILASMAESLYGIDLDGKCTFANLRCVLSLGFESEEELLGKDMYDLIHSHEDGSSYPVNERRIYRSLLKGEKVNVDDEVLWRKDGTSFDAEYWSFPIIKNGQVMGAVVSFLDITKRKAAELEKERAATDLKRLIDTANAPIFGIDSEGRVNEWNQCAERLTGYGKESVLDHVLVEEFITEDYRASVKEVLDRALKGQETANYEFPLYTKDDQRLDILLNATTRRDGNGTAVGVVGVGQDITERKTMEVMLREGEERYRSLIENSNDLIHSCDTEGNFLFVNQAWKSVMECSDQDLEELTIFDFIHPDSLEHCTKIYKDVMKGQSITGLQAIFKDRKGNPIWVEGNSTAMIRDGQVIATHGFFRDVTERVRIEKVLADERAGLEKMVLTRTQELTCSLENLEAANIQLAEANRARSNFLSSMSHELRTPLNSIMGFADLLKRQFFGSLNQKQVGFSCQIGESARHLLDLINDILDTAKIDAGMMELEIDEVDLGKFVDSILSSLKPQFDSKRLKVDSQIDIPSGTIRVDRRKLKQILINLLSNAQKYSHEGGHIELRVYVPEDSLIRFEVIDSGIGIKEIDQEAIFSEFHQVNRKRDEALGGAGIGLALSRRLVDLLGGQIGVVSEEGRGSVFWFTVPQNIEPVEAMEAVVSHDLESHLQVSAHSARRGQ